jgi:hypothetical protein
MYTFNYISNYRGFVLDIELSRYRRYRFDFIIVVLYAEVKMAESIELLIQVHTHLFRSKTLISLTFSTCRKYK